jgi:sirohydrochlorin cobaltochelatase
LNENSAAAAKREVEAIRSRGGYAEVLNTYMEEPPLISGWQEMTRSKNVIVVPFFVSDGLHSYEDIPVLLGIAAAGATRAATTDAGEIFRRNPYKIGGRNLFYAPSIGTDPGFADVILEQVARFDVANKLQTAP